ncbi:hypothetical protein [Szabonella alba]|uniref:Uncharacterized protein n=1 Tax=Szabonella alba TaxID=2804194 RepID=A0A8K0VA15_9RHOB|nr:hypothetical protein [Szabonella alba]MBL4918232.1 hypothetical protein [Szabonella alba]
MKPLIRTLTALLVTVLVLSGALSGPGLAWTEPARGSAERRALMDAIRPHVEAALGAPVEFVVDALRVQGDVAFAGLSPQRPGGGRIDLSTTPMVLREGYYPDNIEVQVLYRRMGGSWVMIQWAIGATDVWFSEPQLCEIWYPVLPEYCR